MKNRIISVLMIICLLVCLFPASAFAEEASSETASAPTEAATEAESTPTEAASPYYGRYTAIGDSICAGFSQLDYEYSSGLDMNIENSPEFCYANLVGKATGSKVFNLGKLGCDTDELLDILTNVNNKYHNTYLDYLKTSDLVTVEIGANDLAMAALSSVLKCLGPEYADMEPMNAFALLVPFVKGDFEGMKESFKTVLGIDLTPEQIKALMLVNSDDVLSKTLDDGYGRFAENFDDVVDSINTYLKENNPDAEFIVLNYYNPYYGFDEALGKCTGLKYTWKYEDCEYTYNIGEVLQVPTDKMNALSEDHCRTMNYKYVDISDVNMLHLLTNGIDPHPNAAGHTLIAAKIVDALNTVTATAQEGGTITPSGINVVKSGSSMKFTIAPNSGAEICDVLVDGKSKGAIKEYTFENINEDHCIAATFKICEETKPKDGTVYYETYTALGDSITAGYTFAPSNPDDCYAKVTKDNLGVKNYYNLGIPAYKTEDLLKALNDKSPNNPFVNDISASDLVTVYIGSNDLTMVLLDMVFEYLGKDLDSMTPEQRLAEITSVMKLLQNGVNSETIEEDLKKLEAKLTQEQIDQIVKTITARYDQAYKEFTVNWDNIITAIRKINQNTAIVALGYYNPVQVINYSGIEDKIGENGKKYIDQINALGALSQGYVDSMNKYISKDSLVSNQYLYVDTTGVELIMAGPIVVDPHPSQAGHKKIADRIKDTVLNDISAVAGDGVTVSPSGKKTVAYGLTDAYTYSYKFTPAAGNTIKEVFVDGSKVDAPDGTYTFKQVTGDHTISVSSAVIPSIPGPGLQSYTVTTNASKGGTITSSANGSVIEGTNVTLTITPDTGYTIDYIEMDGTRISNTSIITISSISANHSVYVAFKASNGESKPKNPFTDLTEEDWFYKEAMYMYGNKIMKGTSETTFGPNVAVSRAMIVAILYRMDSEPAVVYKNDFTDVAKDKWYTTAVLWAAEKGILKGYGNGKLGPEDEVTREQLVSILYQYATYKGYNTSSAASLSSYTDTASVSDWANPAMQWAVKEGLINGNNNLLSPASTATRAEIAAIIYRFLEKY